MTVVVRAQGDVAGIAASARQEIKAIDKNLPVTSEPMVRIFSRSTANRRYNVILLGAFAGLALLLAAVGIYGVISYAVSQSTRELGIRVALGARAMDVLKLVIGHGMRLAVIGVAIGIFAALALTRWMRTLLYQVTATDPMIFGVASLLLIIIALLACYIPARRATKVDPLVALRYE